MSKTSPASGMAEEKRKVLETARELEKQATAILSSVQQAKAELRWSGLTKFENKVKSEIKFLSSVLSGKRPPKKAYVDTSNVAFLEDVWKNACKETNVVGLIRPFALHSAVSDRDSVSVDIVAGGGGRWIKVKSGNPQNVRRNFLGMGKKDSADVVALAEDMVDCAQQHPHMFEAPKVEFRFTSGVYRDVAEAVRETGAIVQGTVIDVDESKDRDSLAAACLEVAAGKPSGMPSGSSAADASSSAAGDVCSVNLDVTSLIVLTSDLTNGYIDTKFHNRALETMKDDELKRPALPIVEGLMKDKKLIVCETAVDKFSRILDAIGGAREKERGRALLKRVQIVPDSPSERAKSLTKYKSSKLTEDNIIIFGTGDQLKSVTLTANMGFVRSAQFNGVSFHVREHPSRALTETYLERFTHSQTTSQGSSNTDK